MIKGVGTDIVNTDRIESIYKKFGEDFLNKNFHPFEIERFHKLPKNKRTSFLAKRFAGKEAVAKALGSGIGSSVAFKDIAILNNDKGAPYVATLDVHGIKTEKISISLSEDSPFAVAFVVITM